MTPPSLPLPKAALKETGSFLVLLKELIAKQGSSNDNYNDNNSNRVSKTSKTSCRVISHCYPIFSLAWSNFILTFKNSTGRKPCSLQS